MLYLRYLLSASKTTSRSRYNLHLGYATTYARSLTNKALQWELDWNREYTSGEIYVAKMVPFMG